MDINRKILLGAALSSALCLISALQAQTPAPAKPRPEELADQWFVRLNELDDWYISVDGREENAAVVDRFVDLYAEDAYHQVGPAAHQIGPVVYHGKERIRKWADDFSRNYVQVAFRTIYMTQKEKTITPFYAMQAPWGGTGAAIEFVAAYRNRQDRRTFTQPGAVFFVFNDEGKISNVRIYMAADELFETGG
jgi:hypothetical protein